MTRSNPIFDHAVKTVLPLILVVTVAGCEGTEMRSAAPDAGNAPIAATDAGSPATMMDDLLTLEGVAKDKILGLANAMPEGAYSWAPMEGVRSASEVFIHIAADNYFIPVIMGVEAPAETGITMDYSTVQAYEAQDLTKAEIVGMLEASFVHLEEAAAATRSNMSAELAFGPNTFTMSSLWAQAITHLHEHLGQSVAYARANEVVPPWSM